MGLLELRFSLIEAKKKKEELMNICDNEIDGIINSISDYHIEDRMRDSFGEAILLSAEEFFFSAVEYLLKSKEPHLGFKQTSKNGDSRFSVRLNLLEQLVHEYYGMFDSKELKDTMLSVLQSWKKQNVPVKYRRTSSVDLVNPESERYPRTYAIEMDVSTFETMFQTYLKTDGNEVWSWNDQCKSQ